MINIIFKPLTRNHSMAFQSLLLVGMAWMSALLPHLAQAEEGGSKGRWKNVDDMSGQPRALTRITEVNGVLLGRIAKVFPDPAEDHNPQCDQREGANKGAPVIGLTTLSGLQKDGDQYTGGKILDPDNGKVYRSKVHLLEGGGKLSARGHIGVPVLCRSQT